MLEHYGDAHRFQFGDTPAMADSGAADVVARRQIATCGSLEIARRTGQTMPEPGLIEIVLNGQEEPVCAIKTSRIEICQFDEVGEAFARAEACNDLAQWQEVHHAYFTRAGVFAPDMKLFCQYFDVIETF